MARPLDALFQPFALKSLQLANRTVMAPMTRWHSPGGVPGEDVAAYYRRRAENGCGLIITEGTVVDHPVSSYSERVPNCFGAGLEGWRHVVEQVHEAGGRIIPQLWHVGAMRVPGQDYPNPQEQAVSPSGLWAPGKPPNGEPLSKKEISKLVDAFARAAADAQSAGFDGLEVHAAHGYLIDQFLWPELNQRQDEYGGDVHGRVRFAVEVVQAVRREINADFPLILRISQWKQQDYSARLACTPEQLTELLEPLCEAGVDAFHCSQRRYWEPEFEGSELNLAGWVKHVTGKPTITVGSVGLTRELQGGSMENLAQEAEFASLDGVVERLERSEFDLVAIGRALLADPAWVRKVREGRFDELSPFNAEALAQLT